MRHGEPEFCHPEFGCDCQRPPLQTFGDLDALLGRLGHDRLKLALRLAKNAEGRYIFGPGDPINGPFSGDSA